MPGISINSPTVACVVNVTWALVFFGLLAVRLRADFVVTEAMVACAPSGRGTGWAAAAQVFSEGGGQGLGAALAGQRSRGAVWSLVNNDWSLRRRPGVGTALPGLPAC